MSLEIPSITSILANNALGAEHGNHLLVGATSEEWTDQVVDLLSDTESAAEMGKRGRKFVMDHFNWRATTKQLESFFSVRANQN